LEQHTAQAGTFGAAYCSSRYLHLGQHTAQAGKVNYASLLVDLLLQNKIVPLYSCVRYPFHIEPDPNPDSTAGPISYPRSSL
jgi:hypothetical protein